MAKRSAAARWLEAVYSARSNDELVEAYDQWARTYDDDLRGFGYTYPPVIAGLVGRYVTVRDEPVLDAGAGTGVIGEVLAVLGYGCLIGIDMSDGMLAVAREKAVYADLQKQVLGQPLDFADGLFVAAVAAGVLTVGHAPPESLDELVRITRPGGHVIFTLTEPAHDAGGFGAKLDALARAGRWRRLEVTRPWLALPRAPSESSLAARGYVFEVI